MNNIKSFAKSSAIFFIGNVLSKLTIFLLLPLCTRTIPPDDYGYYDLSITYIAIAIYILFFEIWTTILRFMYDSDDEKQKNKAVLSGFAIFGASSAVYLTVGVFFGIFSSFDAIGLIFLYGITHNIQQVYTYIARGYQRNVLFAATGVVNAVVMVGLDLVLILGFGMGYKALYISYAAGNLAQVLIIGLRLKVLKNAFSAGFDAKLTKTMLVYSLPLAVNSVAYWLLTSYNRTVINDVLSLTENGYFAVGSKFGAMINLVTTCFTFAWQGFSFRRSVDDPTNGSFFSKASEKYLVFLLSGVTLLLPCCRVGFSVLVGKDYEASMYVIPLFLIVSAVSAYSTFIGNIFCALKDTKSIFISMLAACAVNLLLCHTLIRNFGLNGANISMLISFAVDIFIRNVILRKRIGYKPAYGAVVAVMAIMAFNYFIYQAHGVILNAIILLFEAAVAALYFKNDIKSIFSRGGQKGGGENGK